MDIETKKETILKAIRDGLSKRKIDPKGKGKNVKRMEEKEGISVAKIEEMYENMLRLQKEGEKLPKEKREKIEKRELQEISLSLDRKIGELETALSRVCDTINYISKSLENTKEWIDERRPQLIKTSPLQEERALEMILDLQKRVRALEKKDRLEDGEKKLVQDNFLDKTETKQDKVIQDKISGFTLTQKATTTGDKKYYKWYGVRQIDGKQTWVYIGSDLDKAEEKIEAWLEKHPEVGRTSVRT